MGTTNFLDFAISELQNGALLRSLTNFFLVRLMGFAQFALPNFAFFGIAALA